MTFATDISQPDVTKIVLVEMDIPLNVPLWINYKSGLWVYSFLSETITFTDDQGVEYFYPANVETVPKKIGSCLVESEFYTEAASLAEYETTNKSYFYDEDTFFFYIHFDAFEPPLDKFVRVGVVSGFANTVNSNGAYYDNLYYDPRIKSVPSLSQSKDPLFFGVQKYQSGNISFVNADGNFDNYNDLNIYGQPARIKIGIDGYEYSSFEQIFEGFIEDYSYDFNIFSISVQDKRKNLSRRIPYNTFDQSFYPDLNVEDTNKYKPIVFGLVQYYPVVCINKDESTPNERTFMFLDTSHGPASAQSVNGLAYVKNDEDNNLYDQIAIDSFDATAGTFNILSSLVDNGEDEPRDVFLRASGYDDTGPAIDTLEFVINAFSSITYNSTFFNTTEISTEFSDSNFIGYWIKKPEEIEKTIAKLMFADDGYFYVQNDGRFSAKKYDNDRASTKTIQTYSWLTDPKFKYNTGQFLTDVTVRGSLHVAKNDYMINVENTDYQEAGLLKYKKSVTKELETIISITSDVTAKSENIMLQTKDIVRNVTRTGDMSLYDVDVMDFITTSNKRQSEDEVLEVWEVTGKNLNLTAWNITLEMRYKRAV